METSCETPDPSRTTPTNSAATASGWQRLVAELRERDCAARDGGGERYLQRHREQGKLPVARTDRPAARPGFAVPRAVAARGVGHVRRRRPRRRARHRHRPRVGPRSADRRQRRHGEGRHLLSDHREEARAGAADRAREPAAVRLPGRLRRRVPAAAGRGLSRPRALRPHLLQPGAHVGRAAFRRSPS